MPNREEFGLGIISGLFFGIFVITGQNIDPESLLITVGDTISNATKIGVSNPSPTMWDQWRPFILLISLLSTVGTIIYVITRGVVAIFMAALGFLGIFFLLYSTKVFVFAYVGLILLFIGIFIAKQ